MLCGSARDQLTNFRHKFRHKQCHAQLVQRARLFQALHPLVDLNAVFVAQTRARSFHADTEFAALANALQQLHLQRFPRRGLHAIDSDNFLTFNETCLLSQRTGGNVVNDRRNAANAIEKNQPVYKYGQYKIR